jgi:hypothetical protein
MLPQVRIQRLPFFGGKGMTMSSLYCRRLRSRPGGPSAPDLAMLKSLAVERLNEMNVDL